MSDTTDPIIRASDLRRVLEAMRTWHDKALKDPGCVVEAKIAGVVSANAICEALAALPQREAAQGERGAVPETVGAVASLVNRGIQPQGDCMTDPCSPAPVGWTDEQALAHIQSLAPVSLGAHSAGVPLQSGTGSGCTECDMIGAANCSEHCAAAPPEGEPPEPRGGPMEWIDYARYWRERAEAAQRGCEREHGKRKAAEAELAKLREQEPVGHTCQPGGCPECYFEEGDRMQAISEFDRLKAQKDAIVRRESVAPAIAKAWAQKLQVAAREARANNVGLETFDALILYPDDCDALAALLYAAPVPPADHAQALREARAEVWREAAEMAFEAGAPRLQGRFAAKASEVSK